MGITELFGFLFDFESSPELTQWLAELALYKCSKFMLGNYRHFGRTRGLQAKELR
ncbi:hypothetical protein Pla22_52080 [Rubripirellula amarantea]|uniref:Uncharacterized protein n=1 Tax=Rubripirellula amarantea TaxID=2527999 RepID=A0A5C5WDY8_9BACT|nr:hypothetical protein Pla22_52080 [Rubripirellula amarantea]